MAYTTATLLDDIRVGGMIPAASSKTFTDADLLRLADREMQSGVVPLIMGCREEYFVTHEDISITQSAQLNSIRIPYRAMGGVIRDLALVEATNVLRKIPQLSLDDLEDVAAGFYIEGNEIKLYNTNGSWNSGTVRVSYYRRPSRLVLTSAVGTITTVGVFNGGTLTNLEVSSVPATFSASLEGDAAPYDIVRAKPGYECLEADATGTYQGGTEFNFSNASADIAVGDYMCLPEESPVPQIPSELHPVLVQRVIVKVLEAINDQSGMQIAQAKLGELEAAALKLIVPRSGGAPKKIRNIGGAFRRRRRWYSVI